MTQDHIICLPGKRARTPIWYRVVDGAVAQRGYGFDWRPGDDDAASAGRFLIVLPPEATSLHFIACPDMTLRQGASAARLTLFR